MRTRWFDLAAALVLVVALALRLPQLNVFIAADEMRWTCRALSFGEALRTSDLKNTFQTGHPGVITMWLGTLAVPPGTASASLATCLKTENASAPSAANAAEMAELGNTLFRMRVAAALFNTLVLAGIYALARRVLGAWPALVGLALLAADPFLLAHSRVLHLDAALSGLLTLSVLALLGTGAGEQGLGVREQGSRGAGEMGPPPRGVAEFRWLALAGALAGVALAQKVAAVFLWPWAGLGLLWLAWRSVPPGKRDWRSLLGPVTRRSLTWGIAALIGFVLVWPALWTNPVGTVRGVIDKAAVEGGNPHQAGQFVGEEIVDDPGPLMYVLALGFRTSPWGLVGLAGALWALWRGRRRGLDNLFPGRPVVALVLFALLFAVLISLSPKKFDRYILPVFPPLDLAAGVGLAWLAARWPRWRWAALGGLLATQLALVLPTAPYYLTYYNPLLGGGRAATQWLLVGWGEGYDEAARYLNTLPDAAQTQAAARGVSQFAPFYVGETRSTPGFRSYQTGYVVFYINETQRRRSEGLMQRYFDNPAETPVHVVRLNGIDYAWIYRNTAADAPLAYLRQQAQPGDALVVNGASLAAQQAPSGMPVARVYGHFGARETAEALAQLPAAPRLWYVRYPEGDPGVVLDALREQAILDGDPRQFPDVEVWSFRAAPPITRAMDASAGPLRLTGWGAESAFTPGRAGGVSLRWQATGPTAGDAVQAVEVVDPTGAVVAAVEKPLRDTSLKPSSQWPAGAVAQTLAPVTVPPGTPPGTYTLRARLKGQGLAADAVALGMVRVGRGAAPSAIPNPMARDVGGGLQLVGYEMAPSVAAGGTVEVGLWWRAVGPVSAQSVDMTLRDAARQVGAMTPGPVLAQPVADWKAGEVFKTTRRVAVTADAATGPATVEVTVHDGQGRALMSLPLVLGPLWVQGQALAQPPQPPQQTVNFRVGDTARLIGYDARQTAPDSPLELTLYWQADAPAPTDYSVFVHLLRPDGSILTQVDRAPGLGQYPTSRWRAGEVVVDPYTLTLPNGTPPGPYQVAVGWYTQAGRARVRDTQGQPVAEDRVLLPVTLK